MSKESNFQKQTGIPSVEKERPIRSVAVLLFWAPQISNSFLPIKHSFDDQHRFRFVARKHDIYSYSMCHPHRHVWCGERILLLFVDCSDLRLPLFLLEWVSLCSYVVFFKDIDYGLFTGYDNFMLEVSKTSLILI